MNIFMEGKLNNIFSRVPKLVVTDDAFSGITIDAKLLYALMLDQSSLSQKNGCKILTKRDFKNTVRYS